MKNKLGKKLLIGGACACLLLTGGLTLSGCSLSADQQKALDVLVANTETLVGDFGSYLDGQNAKIDKEKAVEMISKSRLNFIMSNFKNLEMNVDMNMCSGFEDVLLMSSGFKSYYKSENGVKTYVYLEEDEILDLNKSDFNKDYHYTYSNYEEEVFDDEVEYYPGMWAMYSADIFSQAPISEIGEIREDHIYNIKSIDGGYEFEIVANLSSVVETDLSKYEEDAKAMIYNIIMKVEIKNDYITKVNFKGIQVTVPVNDLRLLTTQEGSTIILDDKGLPTISTYTNADVVTMIMDVEYKYEDIDYSAIEEKIAEIEERFITQE